jgi:dolichol kinase
MMLQVVIAVLSVLALFGMAHTVRKLGMAWRLSAETQRKAVHVGVGVHAMLLPLFLGRDGFLVFAALAGLALLVLRLPKVASEGAGASIHSVERRSWGDLFFLLAVLVLFLRSHGDPALYVLPIAVLTLSDAAAAIIGTEYGRMRFGAGDRVKSIEGSVAFFVVTWITVVTILILATEIPRQNIIWLATLVAVFSSLVEADSWRGLDNVFVPVGIHVLLATSGNSTPASLAAQTLLWVVLIAVARELAPRLHLTAHALRAAFVSFFLTAALVGPIFAILPVCAYLAQLAARKALADAPGDHDLDFVSLVVLVGVVWLILGAVFEKSAIEFYTLTFGAIAAGYVVVAFSGQGRASRIAFAIGGTAAVGAIHYAMIDHVPAARFWAPNSLMISLSFLAPAATTAIVVLTPAWFRKSAPGLKLGALSLMLPAMTYVYEVFA